MSAIAESIQTYVGVNPDGDIGPKSIKAIADKLGVSNDIKSIQRAVGVDDDGEVGPITLKAIFDKFNLKLVPKANGPKVDEIIDIAATQVGVFETSQNHGVGIEKYWSACDYSEGYNDRAPYCAAFVTWVIREAGIFSEKDRPKTAAAFGYLEWGDETKGTKVTRHPKSVKKGDITVLEISHVGIATSDSDANGNYTSIEANTSSGVKGSQRDGGGVYRRTRNVSILRGTVTLL